MEFTAIFIEKSNTYDRRPTIQQYPIKDSHYIFDYTSFLMFYNMLL